MALPSQSGRPVSRRNYMYRRRRKRRGGLTLLFMVMAAAIFGVWKLWPDQASADPDAPTPSTGDRAQLASQTNEENVLPHERLSAPTFLGQQEEENQEQPTTTPTLTETERRTALTMGSDVPGDLDPSRSEEPPGTTTAPPPPVVATPESALPTSGRSAERLEAALDLLRMNRPIEARRRMTAVLDDPSLDPAVADRTRYELSRLNERLVFSPEIIADDPYSFEYVVGSGEVLSKIRNKLSLQVDWRFLQRINRISDPKLIRAGDRLKVVTGPFHAVVSKTDYRLDLYMGDGYDRVFVTSLPVGLGEFNSTPLGLFKVREGSKDINPAWRNPRTGERFDRDDPANPIGEHWLGLAGIEEHNRDMAGYGIHGTIEPDSIGRQQSMGCIRMLPGDVAIVWEVLMSGASTVEIRQ